MSRFSVLALVLLSLASVTACSFNGSDEIDYRNSEIAPTLEVPPDLIQPGDDKNLTLPGSKVGLSSNTGRYIETGNLNFESKTLPRIDNIKIEGRGDLHWLSIPYEVEKAYPLLREFWSEQGFELQLDEPIMGMMKTQWMESKAGASGFFAKLIESMRAADSKYQYTTRLHRTEDNTVSHVFIAHREQELVINSDDANVTGVSKDGWQFRDADPSFEYEMLSRLMVFIGMQDEAVKAELEKIGTFAARASIMQKEGDEVTYIAVSDGFEQTWNRLRHQLDRLGIAPVDSSREGNRGNMVVDAGAFYAGLQQANESNRKSLRIALEGHGNSDNTRIDLMDEKGTLDRSAEANQILQSLLQLLK